MMEASRTNHRAKRCATFTHLASAWPTSSPKLLATYLYSPYRLARIIHESVSRDCEDGLATGQPQGVESEAYLNSTSQGPTPEDARKDVHIGGRSK